MPPTHVQKILSVESVELRIDQQNTRAIEQPPWNRTALSPWVSGRNRQHLVVPFQVALHQLGFRVKRTREDYVNLPALEQPVKRGNTRVPEAEAEVRVSCSEIIERSGEVDRKRRSNNPNAQNRFVALRVLRDVLCLLRRQENVTGLRNKAASDIGQTGTFRCAIEQARADFVLQRLDLRTQGWLRYVQLAGSSRKTLRFCNGHKIPEMS